MKLPAIPKPIERVRWLPAVSAYAGVIPAFAAVVVTAVDSSGILTVNQPTANGQDVCLNGPVAIAQGGYGSVTRDFPWYALYHQADGTPANGDTWGAGASSFELHKGNAGFVVEGGVQNGAVLVRGRGSSSGGGGVTSLGAGGVFVVNGPSPTNSRLYDATQYVFAPGTPGMAITSPAVEVWLWDFMNLASITGQAQSLANGDPVAALDSGQAMSATPYGGGGAQTREVFIAVSGWNVKAACVSGAIQNTNY
jgi:hypothetical protein